MKIPIANYFEVQKENKSIENMIEKYNNLSNENINEINELTNIMGEEKSLYILLYFSCRREADIYKKLLFLLFRKIGFSNKVTCNLLKISTTTGNNWINSWTENGYKGLLRKKGQGRKPKVTQNEL